MKYCYFMLNNKCPRWLNYDFMLPIFKEKKTEKIINNHSVTYVQLPFSKNELSFDFKSNSNKIMKKILKKYSNYDMVLGQRELLDSIFYTFCMEMDIKTPTGKMFYQDAIEHLECQNSICIICDDINYLKKILLLIDCKTISIYGGKNHLNLANEILKNEGVVIRVVEKIENDLVLYLGGTPPKLGDNVKVIDFTGQYKNAYIYDAYFKLHNDILPEYKLNMRELEFVCDVIEKKENAKFIKYIKNE